MKMVIEIGPDGPVTIEVCDVMKQCCPLNGEDVPHSHFRCNVCGELGGTTVSPDVPGFESGEGFLSCCFCGIGG